MVHLGVVVLGMTFDHYTGFCAGLIVMGVLAAVLQHNKDPMPLCPGNPITSEYNKDGVMLCRYQQEPIGMKTYKQEMKK